MLVLAQAVEVDASGPPWLTSVIGLLTLLFGGGGIAAVWKVRNDRRMGVSQQEAARDDAIANHWKSMIEAQTKHWEGLIENQTKSLLEPLNRDLIDLRAQLDALKTELATRQQKYWAAISHIRMLYAWISRHMPDDASNLKAPAPPPALAEDIQ